MRNLQPILLDEEIKLLAQEGPSLTQFTKLTQIQQFLPISNLKLMEAIRITQGMDIIQLKNNSNNNIRAFYIAMLLIICNDKKAREKVCVLTKFKQLAYSQNIDFCLFFKSEVKNQMHYKNKLIKKLLIEFLEILKRSQNSQIFSTMQYYPICDIILTMIFRLISCNLSKNSIDYINFDTKIDTKTLVLVFMIKLNIKIILNAGNYVFPYINYSIKEDNQSISMIFNENSYKSSLILGQQNPTYVILSPLSKQNAQIANAQIQFQQNSQQPKLEQAKIVLSSKNICEENLKESVILEKYHFCQINGQPLDNIKKYKFQVKPSIQLYNLSDNTNAQISHSSTKISSQKPFATKYILDGLTGNQVINIMSPRIVNIINQKKKQSMMTISGTTQIRAKLLVQKDTLSQCQQNRIYKRQTNMKDQEKQFRIQNLRKNIQQIRNKKNVAKSPQKKPAKSQTKQQNETFDHKRILSNTHKVNNIKISFTYINPKQITKSINLYPYKTQNLIDFNSQQLAISNNCKIQDRKISLERHNSSLKY